MYVKVAPSSSAYELSGTVNGLNSEIKIRKGDVLTFHLDTPNHPFWIKTVQGMGKNSSVSSGISGIGQGNTTGTLIWDTNKIKEGTYYYQCEFHDSMFGEIIVDPGKAIIQVIVSLTGDIKQL